MWASTEEAQRNVHVCGLFVGGVGALLVVVAA